MAQQPDPTQTLPDVWPLLLAADAIGMRLELTAGVPTTIIKGFVADAVMSPYRHTPPQVWPGILDTVPVEFAAFLTEPAFVLEETTFCIWRRRTDTAWQRGQIIDGDGPDPDDSEALLTILDGEPATYQAFAEAYYERVMPLEAIAAVYAHRPLTIPLIQALNPTITPEVSRSMKQRLAAPNARRGAPPLSAW